MAVATATGLLELVKKSALIDPQRLDEYIAQLPATGDLGGDSRLMAAKLVNDAILTPFQAEQLLAGRWRGFNIGKYRVLERLGSGGMGTVYLAEHKIMKRRAAIKVLPKVHAANPSMLERFYREAQAIAALDHPNIVRAYDLDHDGELTFLVMEYIDGSNLQAVVQAKGPLSAERVAHYVHQAAKGLAQMHQAGLVHRDIKPANLLLDRQGTVKLLDMGLVRFFDTDNLEESGNILGSADFVAPEQATNSRKADIRADIYGLGCTAYFLLASHPPFTSGKVSQKLIWHQTRQPKPLRTIRKDLPETLLDIVEKMMQKDMTRRYQTPAELLAALDPLVKNPIPPPSADEMPLHSPAVLKGALEDTVEMPGAQGRNATSDTVASPTASPRVATPPTARNV